MNPNDYDFMLSYMINKNREDSTYLGDTNIYLDARPLDIFPSIDRVNNRTPLFVLGTVVYLQYQDKILALKQQKKDRVTDTLVGLGGKIATTIKGIPQDEKVPFNKILREYNESGLKTIEDVKKAACREVMEETSTYARNFNTNDYTHEITKQGLVITPERLQSIGDSRIRIINPDKTESWLIKNFIYNLNQEEYEFIEKEVSKYNREGFLSWYSMEELLPKMTLADKLILQANSQNSKVSEIRDNVNKTSVTRGYGLTDESDIFIYQNGKLKKYVAYENYLQM